MSVLFSPLNTLLLFSSPLLLPSPLLPSLFYVSGGVAWGLGIREGGRKGWIRGRKNGMLGNDNATLMHGCMDDFGKQKNKINQKKEQMGKVKERSTTCMAEGQRGVKEKVMSTGMGCVVVLCLGTVGERGSTSPR